MTKDYVNISIPRPLYERCERTIEGTGFRSVTEFIVFITRETLGTQDNDIQERLRALGYIE